MIYGEKRNICVPIKKIYIFRGFEVPALKWSKQKKPLRIFFWQIKTIFSHEIFYVPIIFRHVLSIFSDYVVRELTLSCLKNSKFLSSNQRVLCAFVGKKDAVLKTCMGLLLGQYMNPIQSSLNLQTGRSSALALA